MSSIHYCCIIVECERLKSSVSTIMVTIIHYDLYKAVKVMVGVTIVLSSYETNLKPHKYLCKQYNHSTLNNFCKRGFIQKDLV